MSELTVEVVRRSEVAESICSLELSALQGERLPPFTAGAHIDVQVASNLVRQYSLCGNPADTQRWRIAVQREPGSRGGSAGVHERLLPGTQVRVSAPRNHFALVPAARTVLVAGGIGITPLLAMAYALHAKGQAFLLHYCARSADRMAFRRELERAEFASQVRPHLSAEQGRFDARAALAGHAPESHLYVCGPTPFMDTVLGAARSLGWPEEHLHREHFVAQPPVALPGDTAFDVELLRSGRTCHVPADRTVLSVLLDAGIELPFSCESGICGTCLTRVLQGQPDHRDSYLTDQERAANDQFTPCCSRALSPRLVLDL